MISKFYSSRMFISNNKKNIIIHRLICYIANFYIYVPATCPIFWDYRKPVELINSILN